jgi:hypothetical protein
MRKLGLALEAEETADVPAGDSTVSSDDMAAVEEVTTSGAEVESDNEDLGEATDGVELVEQVQEVLEESATKGEGISETAAEIATLVSEHFRERMGITGRSMPSLEAFGSASSRVAATNLALLSISDTVSRAWEAIKAFFKNIWEKIKEFYKKVFTATGRMKARAVALRAKVANLTGTNEETTFENSTFHHAFQGTNAKYDKKNVTAYTKGLATDMESLSKKLVMFTKLVDDTISAEAKVNATSNKQDVYYQPITNKEHKVTEIISSVFVGTDRRTKAYYGGVILEAVVDASADSALGTKAGNKEKSINMRIETIVPDSKDDSDDNEVDVLTKAEMAEACKDVESLAKANEMFSVVESEIEKITKKISKFADDAKKVKEDSVKRFSLTKADKTTFLSDTSSTKKMLYEVGGIINKLSVTYPSLAIKTGNATLNYVEKCMGYYKK